MIKIEKGSIIKPIPTEDMYMECIDEWGMIPPTKFKEFIQTYNCAKPIQLEVKATDREHMVTRFLGIIKKEVGNSENMYYDILCVQSTLFEIITYDEDSVDYDLLPFAELFGGDYLCLDVGKDREKEDNPRVCVLSHEESDYCNPVTYHVADSFDEFVKKYNIL